MLGAIIGLFLLGLLLLLAEAVLPGGVVGFLGAAAIVASIVLCYGEYGPGIGTLYLLGSVTIALTIGIASFLMVMRKLAITPPTPAEPENPLREQIGKVATVVTTLDPTGFVRLEGKRLQARSESSDQMIEEGSEVEVAGIDSTFLVVRPRVEETK